MQSQSMQPSVASSLRSCIVARPFRTQQTRSRHISAVCSAKQHHEADSGVSLDRRQLLAAAAALALVRAAPATAYTPPPHGKRRNVDVLDGYSFLYPEDWAAVTTSGNDIFYRNPYNVEENLFVNITSPSSSTFDTVESLGSPQQAALRLRQQYLGEFMSTRLGSQKKADIISATSRKADDGRLYYVIEMRAQSYASRSPLASTQTEINASFEKEWDRRLLTTLGVAGKRLYELRLQTPETSFEKNEDQLREIVNSFRCKEVEV